MCRCRECERAKDRKHYAANRALVQDQVKKWRQENPEKVKQINQNGYAKRDRATTNKRNRAKYSAIPTRERLDKRLRRMYGITAEHFDEMMLAQGGACAVCLVVTRLVVDHNHTTGEVRGLLCHHCNSALGMLKESERSCLNLLAYIQRYSGDAE
jgi:hypothetical protein